MHFKRIILTNVEDFLEDRETKWETTAKILTRNKKRMKKGNGNWDGKESTCSKDRRETEATDLCGSLAMENEKEEAKMNASGYA